MLAATALLASIVGAELGGYLYHLRVLNFAKKKRYFDTEIETDLIEKMILEEMSVEELTTWISNSISYNCSEDHKYYNTVPLDKVPKNKMLKWTCYYLYFKSMWQLTEEQIKHGEKVLERVEKKIGITFPDIDDPDIYFLKFGNNKLECK